MIVSRKWLERHIDAPLPAVASIANALTFHAFEIEETKDQPAQEKETLDVKVLPNRAADCLSHRGIAREVAAILDIPAKPDLLRQVPEAFPKTDSLVLTVEDARACPRHMGALVKGVKVAPSPDWLREALESVGQRSINNVVDATNYVMLDLGQPSHAFDAAKLANDNGVYRIGIRGARDGETMTILSGESFPIPRGVLVVEDQVAGVALDIAGVKGGAATAITEATTDLFVSVANFDGPTIRKASQLLKLWTDASKRFQNDISPELPSHGMKAVLKLIHEVAGGELIGVTDFYPAPVESVQIPCSVERINRTLGSELTGDEVEGIFKRLGFAYKRTENDFTVDPPFERRDLTISQNLVEEVGRIWGYDKLPSLQLPPIEGAPDQSRFRGIERMKDQLVEEGFIEVSTQSFAKKGDIKLANPLDTDKPYLRASLEENLKDALAKAKLYAPLVLPPNEKPKLFEVGTVFPKEGEHVELRMTEKVPAWGDAAGTVDNLSVAKLEDYGKDYEPKKVHLGAFKPFSVYPFIARDVAFWGPEGVFHDKIENLIRAESGELVVRVMEFDTFTKDGRVSYAYRIVFQSNERTLTDDEVNAVMEIIYTALRAAGYEVR